MFRLTKKLGFFTYEYVYENLDPRKLLTYLCPQRYAVNTQVNSIMPVNIESHMPRNKDSSRCETFTKQRRTTPVRISGASLRLNRGS